MPRDFNIESLLNINNSNNRDHNSGNSSRNAGCCECSKDAFRLGGRSKCMSCRCRCHEKERGGGGGGGLSMSFGSRSSNSQISKQQDSKVKRTTYSDHQKKVMSHYYENGNRYLESSMRKKIAEELGLRPDQVKRKWQNMRAQDKQVTPNFGLNTGSFCSAQSSFMIDRNRGLARISRLTDTAAQRRTTGNYQNNIQLYQNNTSGFFSATRQDSGSKSLGSHLPFSTGLGYPSFI